MKKQEPYVLVESDGTSSKTRIYIVSAGGKRTKIPMVSSASWEASATTPFTSMDLKLINPRIKIKTLKKYTKFTDNLIEA